MHAAAGRLSSFEPTSNREHRDRTIHHQPRHASPPPVLRSRHHAARWSQVEGSATVEDKLRIAEQLDVLGVDFIEGGWPGANPKDIEFFER